MVIASDHGSVRDALRGLIDTPLFQGLSQADRGTAEIVLAEALNNVVEHACRDGAGLIKVTAKRTPTGLCCRIVDTGGPMPGDRLPPGHLRAFGNGDDLPEGGFGWFLIRRLCQDLHYRRLDDGNQLSFHLRTEQIAP